MDFVDIKREEQIIREQHFFVDPNRITVGSVRDSHIAGTKNTNA